MTTSVLDPLTVIDTRDGTWLPYTDDGAYHRLMDWAAEQGIPDDVCRVEVYLLDTPFARIYRLNAETRTLREPYDAPLSSLPPTPLGRGERHVVAEVVPMGDDDA